jgi:hypothetical protein
LQGDKEPFDSLHRLQVEFSAVFESDLK